MPEVPWEFLATRLGRYLQLSYVSAVIAGAIILFSIWTEAIGGTPEHCRFEISKQLTQVTSHRSIVYIVTSIFVTIVVCYIVGSAVRYLTWWVVNKVRVIWLAIMGLTGLHLAFYKFRRRFSGMAEEQIQPNTPSARREEPHRRRLLGVGGKDFDVATPRGAVAYLWSVFALTNPTADQIWSSLTGTYGKKHVLKVLRPHPIHVPPTENWQMEAAAEYCHFWLLRYAKDVAVTLSATRALIASSMLVPVFFVPSALENVLGAQNSIVHWADLLEIWVLIILFYLVFTGQRNRGAAADVFRRFVLVQLLEDAHASIEDTRKIRASTNGQSSSRPNSKRETTEMTS
jgi:hypothetical protein